MQKLDYIEFEKRAKRTMKEIVDELDSSLQVQDLKMEGTIRMMIQYNLEYNLPGVVACHLVLESYPRNEVISLFRSEINRRAQLN
ncbi:MAG: hypothetical protein AABX48_04225 [Nanoarchaeota archaeon]